MPKRGKDRQADLGDEDYDWIKSLGEGRANRSSPASPAVSTASSPGGSRSSGLSSRSSLSAPPPRQPQHFADDEAAETDPGRTTRSGQENGSSPRRGRDPDRFGLDDYGLDNYGAIGAAALGHGGGSGGRRGARSDDHGGRGPAGPGHRGPGTDYGSGEPGQGARPDSSDSRTTPGRAVRVTAGRAVDLQANPADALFNPAAADYGQPLYSVPEGTQNGTQYSLHDTGVRPSTSSQPAWHDDPFADTDAGRARALPPGQAARGGWSEFEDRSATVHWPDPPVRPLPADGLSPVSWAEPTGWPETDEEQGAAEWSEPTGWPEFTGETALAPDSDSERRSGLHGRTGPQPRVDDPSSGLESAPTSAAAPTAGRKQKRPSRRQAPAGRKAASRKAGSRKKAGVRPEAAIANGGQRSVTTLPSRPGDQDSASTGPLARTATAAESIEAPVKPATKSKKAAKAQKKAAARRPRRRGRRILLLACTVIVAALGVAAYVVLRPVTSHVISTPSALGSFTRQDANAAAAKFKHRLLAAAGSDVKNVVAAVYQRSKGPSGKAVPQVMVFIGGNLAGNASASSLISAYMNQMQGSFSTSPGKLGGKAACAPGSGGGPAECAWADGDTFGVVVSASLKPAALANEMRQMRPQVERVSK